ncbi:MAG: DNA protecting protein DprA [Rhodospirillales bacterium RIFCSPLOWO2_12_FULL_67_15]|nr:MAG: DNA protecting protein DprA [Rhodospirillales bacterium RIFCSPLOWO2_12_FULL_67_15]
MANEAPLRPGTDGGKSRTLPATEKRDWLRLIRSERVGPVTFYRLIERFGSAAEALLRLPELASRGGGPAPAVCSKPEAEAEMEKLAGLGGSFVAFGEPAYPPLLAHIEDAPPLLALLGHASLLARKTVAVVGARNATLGGRRFARALAADLGREDYVVASGMARGIDAAGHEGALASGTVAVLGGGVDVLYPPENAALYEKIREQGAIVSEMACGTQPLARHFPRRNRIISGISRGVVVVEASPQSGSLITARFALDQGREVFAVPGAPGDPRAQGTNGLIRQGAVLTESASDVVAGLAQFGDMRIEEPPSAFSPGDMVNADIEAGQLAQAREIILENLGLTPLPVDEIIRSCQFSPAVVLTILLELELAGRLERHPGNQVSRLRGA